ncbi:MAG: HD domain-containing protein [Candidatus Solibacter usitatus]|nr:HD domain-containing protein [Candidatus Solibacter usitatus]
MKRPHRKYEIRCPIHGFIEINDWERAIIDEPAFQRLRRIRQLAWTDHIYPGAMHTRFEHSLGVMHTASMLYDAIVKNSLEVLRSELSYNEDGLRRDRQLVRLAALLHDVGHGPFSHAAEELLPHRDERAEKYKHEQYSAAIVRWKLAAVIEGHDLNANYGFLAEDVAALLEGSSKAKQGLFWRDLVDGQMDADRMDYLLRDSYHAGVQYGRFDLHRVINTVCAIRPAGEENGGAPRLGVLEGGVHGAEGLVLARYFMFTQVYFHKTRVAFDVHLRHALKEILPGGVFPKPTATELDCYLAWDDWRVLGLIAQGEGGEHGRRLGRRDHFRNIYHTPEVTERADLSKLEEIKKAIGPLLAAEESATKSWYKTDKADIPVFGQAGKLAPLSSFSSVLANLKMNNQVLLYAKPEDAGAARKKVDEVLKKS